MFSILGFIPSILTFLTGLSGTAGKISGDIRDLQIARENAKTDKEKAIIDAQIQESHDRKDAIVAEAGSRINGIVRSLIVIPPALVLYKLMAFDKVIGSLAGCSGEAGKQAACHIFRTDPLDAYQWGVITAVIAFFFLYDMGKRK